MAGQDLPFRIDPAPDRLGANLLNHYRAGVVVRCREPVTLNDGMRRFRSRVPPERSLAEDPRGDS